MKRSEFKQMVKAFSIWKIDKRKGDYKLPSGKRLSDYLEDLTHELCENNKIAFAKNGNVYGKLTHSDETVIFIPFAENERFDAAEQEARVRGFVRELLN